MVLVRQELGSVLRDLRLQEGRTLREVAAKASVALGYLSEVERGQKEVSSEILGAVAHALETPVSTVMRELSDRLQVVEALQIPPVVTSQGIPDTIPDELIADFDGFASTNA